MKVRKLTRAAMLSALACVLTIFPQIPTPTGGYVHFGDSIIYIAAVFLGPVAGAVVGAVGHSLADIMSGYVVFAIPTFIIKGLMGFIIGKILYNKIDMRHIIFAGVAALIVVTLGYFVAELPLYGLSGAMLVFVSSPIQWLMSIAATAVLVPLLVRVMKNHKTLK